MSEKRALWLTKEEADELQKLVQYAIENTSYPLEPELFKVHDTIRAKATILANVFDTLPRYS